MIGNLGKEPEVRSFQNGGQVCNFSLATTRKWKNKDGEPGEKTEWHNVVVRDKNLVVVAERFLTKGTRIYLEGRIEQRQYEQEGTTKYISEVVLAPFEGRLHIEARGKGWRDTEDTQSVKLDDDIEDDIPF